MKKIKKNKGPYESDILIVTMSCVDTSLAVLFKI